MFYHVPWFLDLLIIRVILPGVEGWRDERMEEGVGKGEGFGIGTDRFECLAYASFRRRWSHRKVIAATCVKSFYDWGPFDLSIACHTIGSIALRAKCSCLFVCHSRPPDIPANQDSGYQGPLKIFCLCPYAHLR